MRYARLIKRIDALFDAVHARRLTPERKRLAWAAFCQTGQLPDDPELAAFCHHLQAAETQFDKLHTTENQNGLA